MNEGGGPIDPPPPHPPRKTTLKKFSLIRVNKIMSKKYH